MPSEQSPLDHLCLPDVFAADCCVCPRAKPLASESFCIQSCRVPPLLRAHPDAPGDLLGVSHFLAPHGSAHLRRGGALCWTLLSSALKTMQAINCPRAASFKQISEIHSALKSKDLIEWHVTVYPHYRLSFRSAWTTETLSQNKANKHQPKGHQKSKQKTFGRHMTLKGFRFQSPLEFGLLD